MMNVKELGFMATQYERYGNITESEVIDAFIDEELDVTIEMLGDYNEYLSENGCETYFNMEELDKVLGGLTPLQIIQKTYFGNFNWSDDFCKYNGYENIDSFSETQIEDEMREDRNFLRWYVEQNELISNEDMEAAIKWGGKFLVMGF